ncbi:MAG: DUF1624 domain-containing protein [Flavobacteriales bacterium]|nr:DUF1624 domain-containing protein [Flavobacteriales bacterium]
MKPRIISLDLLRGIIMVVMALDHTRDFFHYGLLFGASPTDLDSTTPLLFFTRWITHYCAPVFVFLAGTSAYLYGTARTTKELSRFLWTRGAWMIFTECVIVAFGWTFDITFSFAVLAVFWAIGVSMIALALLVYLPYRVVLTVGLSTVLLHNLLDLVPLPQSGTFGVLFAALHEGGVYELAPERLLTIQYPVLPWIGTMALGYCLGRLFTAAVTSEQRQRWLVGLGSGAVILFIALRAANVYGDPAPWLDQPSTTFDILSFLNTTKYPPSLLYLCMTLGPALLFLAWAEGRRPRWSEPFVLFGRVPYFYYMLHIYLIHGLATLAMLWQGEPVEETVLTAGMRIGRYENNGFSLAVVYAVWAVVVTLLYFPCRWYAGYRAAHRDTWWLSYL